MINIPGVTSFEVHSLHDSSVKLSPAITFFLLPRNQNTRARAYSIEQFPEGHFSQIMSNLLIHAFFFYPAIEIQCGGLRKMNE